MKRITLKNEDGTIIDDFPKNPLISKWEKKYPKKGVCKVFEQRNIINYACLKCGKCPDGDMFEIPKEDLQEYKQYLLKLKEYDKIHNTNLAKVLSYKINEEDI